MKVFEITYDNDGHDWIQTRNIAEYFANPQNWGRSKDSLTRIKKIEQIS